MVATDMRMRAHAIPKLSARAELALLARILWREGYDDHQVGHMTFREPDGTYLALPLELGWNEVRASDVLRIDGDGQTDHRGQRKQYNHQHDIQHAIARHHSYRKQQRIAGQEETD